MVTLELRDSPSRAGRDGHGIDCGHSSGRARRRVRLADPLLQMTLRSRFQRFDRTPPYFEDLRTFYAMPILDWAVIFKPQFWLFFIAPPAIAYSFYHFLLITMFVVGFTLLFSVSRWPRAGLVSYGLSAFIYFSAYV